MKGLKAKFGYLKEHVRKHVRRSLSVKCVGGFHAQIEKSEGVGGRSCAASPPLIWSEHKVTREDLIAALREAFDAGVCHGEDSATAYEWGSRPRYSRDQMFEDCIAHYNGADSPIQRLLSALTAPQYTMTDAPTSSQDQGEKK